MTNLNPGDIVMHEGRAREVTWAGTPSGRWECLKLILDDPRAGMTPSGLAVGASEVRPLSINTADGWRICDDGSVPLIGECEMMHETGKVSVGSANLMRDLPPCWPDNGRIVACRPFKRGEFVTPATQPEPLVMRGDGPHGLNADDAKQAMRRILDQQANDPSRLLVPRTIAASELRELAREMRTLADGALYAAPDKLKTWADRIDPPEPLAVGDRVVMKDNTPTPGVIRDIAHDVAFVVWEVDCAMAHALHLLERIL